MPPTRYTGPPMDLANMRAQGVRSLSITVYPFRPEPACNVHERLHTLPRWRESSCSCNRIKPLRKHTGLSIDVLEAHPVTLRERISPELVAATVASIKVRTRSNGRLRSS
jgi:hypothetical protein